MFTVIVLTCSLKSMSMPSFALVGYCVSELHAHLCPYHNVWPEGQHSSIIVVFTDFYQFTKFVP